MVVLCLYLSMSTLAAQELKKPMITVTSEHTFAETVNRLKAQIEEKGLNLFAVIDHAAGATKANLELAPNTLIIFGNPKVGTLLMQSNAQMGYELPLKFLVSENEQGQVLISYRDPLSYKTTYRLEEKVQVLENVGKALAGISGAAAR